ncbi:MAG: site-specific integrase [Clostridiales Family XIII bacterium]|nr:site-specific integrase [Clostridiales Family XIII bacterium]
MQNGKYFSSRQTFKDFTDTWMVEHAEKNLKTMTINRYRGMLPTINAAIGNIELTKLQPLHIIEFMSDLAEKGKRLDAKCTSVVDLAKLTQKIGKEKFAKEAGLAYSTLRQAERGKPVSYKTAMTICETLGRKFEKTFVSDNTSKYSEKTLLHYYRLISVILQTAVYWQIIPDNPCDRVRPPSVKRKEAKAFDDAETTALIKHLEKAENPFRTAIYLLLDTGMRRGELLGLKWGDLNLTDGRLTIERNLLYTPEKGVFEDTTKTESSNRMIALSKNMVTLLKRYSAYQKERRLAAGDRWVQTDYVFTDWKGEAMRPDTLSRWFTKFIATTKLPRLPLKSLRHTNATHLIMAGVPVRAVSDRLGHAQPTTTLNVYSHAIKSYNEQAAQSSPLAMLAGNNGD